MTETVQANNGTLKTFLICSAAMFCVQKKRLFVFDGVCGVGNEAGPGRLRTLQDR